MWRRPISIRGVTDRSQKIFCSPLGSSSLSMNDIVYLNCQKRRLQSSERTIMLLAMAELQHRREQYMLIKTLTVDYRLSKSIVYQCLNQIARSAAI